MLRVFNKVLKVKVQQLANKNQFVITYAKPNSYRVYSFQSYDSLIAVYDTEDYTLYINGAMWDISKTTLKHLKMFVNEWTSFRYITKQQFSCELIKNQHIEIFKE